jgi:Amt family ammonium transporter
MAWTWSPYGGYLKGQGFYDRGGSIVIFYTGAIGGLVGSVVLGPRYGRFMSKADIERVRAGGAE